MSAVVFCFSTFCPPSEAELLYDREFTCEQKGCEGSKRMPVWCLHVQLLSCLADLLTDYLAESETSGQSKVLSESQRTQSKRHESYKCQREGITLTERERLERKGEKYWLQDIFWDWNKTIRAFIWVFFMFSTKNLTFSLWFTHLYSPIGKSRYFSACALFPLSLARCFGLFSDFPPLPLPFLFFLIV